MPLRFVILHHTGYGEPHYDLMFETAPGSALTTYRLPTWPITTRTPIETLGDHRPAYLSYEGPVSNNRGQVKRIAAGDLILEQLGRVLKLVLPHNQSLLITDHRHIAPLNTKF